MREPVGEGYLLLPAPHIGSMELLSSLRSMDLSRVLGIYRPEFAAQHRPPGAYLVDDFGSYEALGKKIERWRLRREARFAAVIGIDDEEQFELSAQLAQRYGLEYHSRATLSRASNKWLLKRALFEHGVPTARCALISDAKDPEVMRVGFPSVLKMLAGSGSEFIMLNESEADLANNLTYLQRVVRDQADNWFRRVEADGLSLDPRRQFLLEGYLAGEEYSCDFSFDDSRSADAHVIRVVKKYPARHLGYFKGFHLLNRASLARCGISLPLLEAMCGRIARALGLMRGVCMVDLMLTADGLQVIETSVRPGLSTFVPLMAQVYGYTSLGLLAQSCRHRAIACDIPAQEGLVVHILAPRCGKITRFDTARLEGLPGLIAVHRYEEAGGLVTDSRTDHWGSLLGYVLIRNPDPERIEPIFRAVEESIDLRIEDAPVAAAGRPPVQE